MPFPDNQFDLVHTSAALHEMEPSQLQILKEVYRVLKPAGVFTLVDFHAPSNWVFWPGLSLFFVLFETRNSVATVENGFGWAIRGGGFQLCRHFLQVAVCR